MKTEVFFPGYTRKSITFSIDDGNVMYDRKFLDIVKPCGIKGTFNLCSHSMKGMTKEEYVKFYEGYEIANHCKYHPFAFRDDKEYKFTDEIFDENTADPELVYKKSGIDDQYMFRAGNGWRMITDADTYLRYEEEGKRELEAVFGEGSVKSFVWPYGKQCNKKVLDGIFSRGYYGVRMTGDTFDRDGFAIPKDRNNWSYNANNVKLLEVAKMYEAYPDDGGLKFFCFGVHSVDFERSGNWNELEEFAKKYGNRSNDYWYASVGAIFAYEDAVNALIIGENMIENPSDIAVYVKINGEEKSLYPKSILRY